MPLRAEHTKEPNLSSDTVKEQGHRERNIEKVYMKSIQKKSTKLIIKREF